MCLALATAEDDVFEVYVELITMAGSWKHIAAGLRLPHNLICVITKQHSNNPENCLFAVVEEWLKGIYDVQKYGHPSWCTLVQAVADPAGGANPALARSIAANHPGNYHSPAHVTESSVVSHVLVSPVTSVPGEESDKRTVQTAHQAHSKRILCVHILNEKISNSLFCYIFFSYIV